MLGDPFDVSDVTPVDDTDAATPEERWSRLQGLMAMLALPPVRHADGSFRRRTIEIEIAPRVWEPVTSVIVEDKRIMFLSTPDIEYVFPGGDVPRWRCA